LLGVAPREKLELFDENFMELVVIRRWDFALHLPWGFWFTMFEKRIPG
jgi:hypothetical protein